MQEQLPSGIREDKWLFKSLFPDYASFIRATAIGFPTAS